MTINAIQKNLEIKLASDGNRYSAAPDGIPVDPPLPGGQLAEGHFVPAKMPMTAVFPRPDSETGADAQHRWAYNGLEYSQPIGVQGGAAPFYYELVTAPAGTTITSFLTQSGGIYSPSTDYGVVKWTPSVEGGTETITVKVYDQEANFVLVTWTVTVDSTKFVFVDPAASGGGTGVIGSPFTWTECFGTSSSVSNNAGKIVYFRGGTISVVGNNASGNFDFDGDIKPKSWLAYPGETPILDFATAKILWNQGGSGSMNDCAFIGLRYQNGRQDVNNAHYFWATGLQHRLLWWKNYFDGLGKGLVGNDNPACIFLPSVGSPTNPRTYVAIIRNTFTGLNAGSDNGVAAHDSYNTRYMLIEHNTYKNSTSNEIIWRKGGHQYSTARFNTAVEGLTVGEFGVLVDAYGTDGNSVVGAFNESCYNKIRVTSGSAGSIHWNTTSLNNTDTHSYRNTVYGERRCLSSQAAGVTCGLEISTDSEWTTRFGATNITVPLDNINASGDLTLTAKSTYLGLYGAEIT